MNRREAGFTLVEIIAALSIFLVVMSASYALFESGRSVASHGEYEARRFQSARAAIRALETDLAGVFGGTTTYNTGFLGKNAGTVERPLDTLDFVSFNQQPKLATPPVKTTSLPPPKEIDISRVAWSVDEDPSTTPAGLVCRRTRLLTEIVTVKDPSEGLEEVAGDVVGLKFRYYDGANWTETWDSTTSGTLPKVVEITVHVKGVWREKEEVVPFSTKVFLPVAAATPKKTP